MEHKQEMRGNSVGNSINLKESEWVINNQKIIKVMPVNPQQKKNYSNISYQSRLELIDLVQNENYPVNVASDLLGFKLSTAKLIISKFRSNGYVTKHRNGKNSDGQYYQGSSSKKKVKNKIRSTIVQQASEKPATQNQVRPSQLSDQNQRQVENNYGDTPFSYICFGIVPWNVSMLPFIYVWNPLQ